MALNRTEKVLLTGLLLDTLISIPLCTLGFLSGSASATTEAVRTILLEAIDVFVLAVMMAINRRRFSRFEFGLEKLQIMVQIVIAVSMAITMFFVGRKILHQMFHPVPMPIYLDCLIFAGFSYVNVLINISLLRRLLREMKTDPSLILRGQMRNRCIMLASSVVATIAAACAAIPDRVLFQIIDTIGAVLVFSVIVYTVANMLGSGLRTLLDAPIDEKEKLGIYHEVVARYDDWEELAFLRTRRLGHRKYVEIGLVFDGGQALEASLAVCSRIEQAVKARVADVLIAVRPAERVAAP